MAPRGPVRELEIAGSYANTELVKFFRLAGQSDVKLDNRVRLTANLDPERALPYGPWKRARAANLGAIVNGQPWSAGIINPVASGAVCVVERFAAEIAANQTCNFVVLSPPAALHLVTSTFISFDGSDTSSPNCPIGWYVDGNLAAGGQIVGNELTQNGVPTRADFNGCALFPGMSLSVTFPASAVFTVLFDAMIRWISPAP